MAVLWLFLPLPVNRAVEVPVPVCRLCREWHSLSRIVGLLLPLLVVLALGVTAIFLGASQLADVITGVGWALYVLLVLGLILFVLWFGGTRLVAMADKLVLGVKIVGFSRRTGTLTLEFSDPVMAREVARLILAPRQGVDRPT